MQTRSAGQNQSVLSVTSAMIQAATAASDTFLLEDKEISQVSTCGARFKLMHHVMSGDICW